MPQWPFNLWSRDRGWYLDGDGDGTSNAAVPISFSALAPLHLRHRHQRLGLEKQLSILTGEPLMLKQPITCKNGLHNILGSVDGYRPSSLYSFHVLLYVICKIRLRSEDQHDTFPGWK
jgi:hypothetical protein